MAGRLMRGDCRRAMGLEYYIMSTYSSHISLLYSRHVINYARINGNSGKLLAALLMFYISKGDNMEIN